MAKARDYRELRAWQEAMDLTEVVYRLTAEFPPEERFGFTLLVQALKKALAAKLAATSRSPFPVPRSRST